MAELEKKSSEHEVHHWETLSESSLVETPIFSLKSKRCRHPKRGSEGDFYVIESNDWVNVLPITVDHQVILVNQYRFGVECESWELPGGVIDDGENDPVEAGLRELREETGYTSKSAELMQSIRPNPAIQNNFCHLVVARNCVLSEQIKWDEHEEISMKLVPIEEVFEMAFRGEIFHSLSVTALFFYYPELQKLKARRREG